MHRAPQLNLCLTHTEVLTLKQHPYDPGSVPRSANQCMRGNVYVKSNLLRKQMFQQSVALEWFPQCLTQQ